MKLHRLFAAAGSMAAILFVAAFTPLHASGQSTDDVPAKTILTVLSKSSEETPMIAQDDVKIKVNGKSVKAPDITPLRGDRAGLELVILIDSGARNSLGRQLSEIADFVKSLPPTTEVGIAYMSNGRAVFQQPFTADKARALQALHLPGGTAGSSASPYFCISDLAKHWPSRNTQNRREVVVITDGIDPYQVRFDPSDPYVAAATNDAIRAGVVVDALYWHDMGIASRVGFLASGGQNLLSLITSNTGGMLYYQGLSNPVSFAPFFRDLSKRLDNQYELSFMAPAKKKAQVASLSVKVRVPGIKANAPNLVYVPAS
jgi:hypothetical protein